MAGMSTQAQVAYLKFREQMHKLNGAPTDAKSFSVEPSVQQRLETKIQKSSAFLSMINVVGVDELKGEKLGLGISGPIASRTDTDTKERETRDLTTLDKDGYELYKTNFDSHVKYATVDAWAKFPDFQNRMRDVAVKRQRLDRIMIGWNGVKVAKNTDKATYPMLQDVNTGWLQKIRDHAPGQIFDASGFPIGGAKYKNIDALVFDVLNTYIEEEYLDESAFVAISGRSILLDKYFPLVNDNNQPTEKIAADMIISQKRMGNLQAVQVPYFPKTSMLLTPLSNLSIYYQNGGRRMSVKDKPERDRVETYESSNEGYVIENYNQVVLIENITQA